MTIPEHGKRMWKKAEFCNCIKEDCHPNNHRLCYICKQIMFYGSYITNKKQNNSKGAWSDKHKIPRPKTGGNKRKNFVAAHILCIKNNKNEM